MTKHQRLTMQENRLQRTELRLSGGGLASSLFLAFVILLTVLVGIGLRG